MADVHQKLQEEKILKGIRARRRFKAAFRHVLHNMYWLDDEEDDIDPNNLKTTYRLAKKRKPKQGFSFKEKVLLRKKIEYRTEEEISYLHKFIGSLKCFRQYPEEVQLALVGVTFFEYFGPGRMLIRQNHQGHALYILLSGEAIVLKNVWDEITNEYVEEKVATIAPGTMFGEISLLHNIPRTATVFTSAPCELLVLNRDDFDRVLKASLMEKWAAIREAMSKFIYFDEWDNVKMRECCLLSKIKTFSTNQVVYGDRVQKKGAVKMTYFLAEGECKVVEHMYIQETVKHGIKYYKLYVPPVCNLENKVPSIVLDVISYEEIKNNEKTENETKRISYQVPATELEAKEEEVEGEEEIIDPELASLKNKLSLIEAEKNLIRASKVLSKQTGSIYKDIRSLSQHRQTTKAVQDFIRRVTVDLLHPEKEEVELRSEAFDMEPIPEHSEVKEKYSVIGMKNLIQGERRRTECMIQSSMKDIPKQYELVFMQVCTLSERASFEEGDVMNNRRVIALSPVKVLVIPTYWLVQQNKGNIATRLERYVRQRIPTTEQVFEKYKKNKKWQEYKKKLRDEILSKKKISNNTTIHDVPYSIRIMNNY